MEVLVRGCVLCQRGCEALCLDCSRLLDPAPDHPVPGVGPVPALFAYAGLGARLVQALKFRDGRRLVGTLADGLCGLVPAGHAPVLSWIPTTATRRRERGFDQSELLARAVARRLGVRCRPVLRRRPGPAQTGRSRAERTENVVFDATRRLPASVVLVDDVCTTGATIRQARRALAGSGGAPAFVVVARTP